jgi:hypothetical protein
MPKFDPNAYLKSEAFDPDDYLSGNEFNPDQYLKKGTPPANIISPISTEPITMRATEPPPLAEFTPEQLEEPKKTIERRISEAGIIKVPELVKKSVQSGVSSMNAQIMRLPAAAFAIATLPSNLIAKAAGLPQTAIPDILINNPATRYYEKIAKESAPPELSTDSFETLKKGDMPALGRELAAKFLANAPTQAAIIASAMAGMPTAGLVAMGAISAAGATQSAAASGVDPVAVAGDIIANGTFESASERLGTFGLLKKWETALAQKFGKAATKQIFLSVGKAIASSAAGEATEEGINSMAQDFADYATGVNPKALTGMFSRAVNAAMVGGVSGGAMTGPGAVAMGYAKAQEAAGAPPAPQAGQSVTGAPIPPMPGTPVSVAPTEAELGRQEMPVISISPTASPAALDRARAIGATNPIAAIKSVVPASEWANVDALGIEVTQAVEADASVPTDQKRAMTARVLNEILNNSIMPQEVAQEPLPEISPETKAAHLDVADTSESIIRQAMTEHGIEQGQQEALLASHDALTTPVPTVGKPVIAMSEAEFTQAIRQSLPEDEQPDTEEIGQQYDAAMEQAKAMALIDDTDIIRANAEILVEPTTEPAIEHEFDTTEGVIAALPTMKLEEAQAEFPDLTEDEHKAMVKDAVDSYQLDAKDVIYPDVKTYATQKAKAEQDEQYTKDELARQMQEKGHITPILNMLFKVKLNRKRSADFIGGELDPQELCGYFTNQGGLSPSEAAERAWINGWISENGENELFDAIDKELRLRYAVSNKGKTAAVGFKEEGQGYQAAASITPEFKAWFGASKVVDEKGAPLVVYHGSGAEFTEFDTSKIGTLGTSEGKGFYFTSNPKRAEGYKQEGGKLFQVFLNIKKPMELLQRKITDTQLRNIFIELLKSDSDALSNYGDIEFEGKNAVLNEAVKIEKESDSDVDLMASIINGGTSTHENIAKAFIKITGYDGVITDWRADASGKVDKVYVAFLPNQIKDISNTSPTFSPNILMSPGQEYAPAAPPFYSKLQRLIEQKMSGPMQADQLKGMVAAAGIKADELDWYDLNGFLKDNPKPTKAQVMDYLAANALEIKEITLGDNKPKWSVLQENRKFQVMENGKPVGEPLGSLEEALSDKDELERDWTEGQNHIGGPQQPAKFSKYQLPGGENYREVLFTLPLSKAADEARIAELVKLSGERQLTPKEFIEHKVLFEKTTQPGFRSSHWSEPNVLVHLRLNDRTVDGKKVLFIEEVQSDWHQEGREEGYKEEGYRITSKGNYLPGGISDKLYSSEIEAKNSIPDLVKEFAKKYPNAVTQIGEDFTISKDSSIKGVSNAPLKKTWHEMVMKRAIRMAAEQGYDALAWTTGAQQAERYDLSKQVDSVQVRPNPDGTYSVQAKRGGNVPIDVSVKKDELAGTIGKELAQKVANGEGDKKGNWLVFTGDSLKVGGYGMSGFYDSMLPSFVNKFTKKWGGKVEDGLIPTDSTGGGVPLLDTPAHILKITPAMREAAMSEGFPLFSPGHVYQPAEMLKSEADAFTTSPEVANAQAVADVRKVRPVGQWHDLRSDPAIKQIDKDFMERQMSGAIGKKIFTIQDVAEIAALARHPLIEHFTIVKLKKGKITGSLVLTSGKIGYVDPSMAEIQAFVSDADEFYASHNHPSGNATPSVEDIASTKSMAADKRFKGHVVTDHQTYTAIMPDGTAIAQEFKGEKVSFRTDIEKMSVAPAVVGWARGTLQGGKLGIMFVDAQNQVMSFDQVNPRSNFNLYIKRHAKGYGATGVFLVAGEDAYSEMSPRKLQGQYEDFIVLNNDGSYRSAKLGYVPGFNVVPAGGEGYFEALSFSESQAEYKPEDYNKIVGRWKPGMTLTLRSRLITPLFPDGLPRGTEGKLMRVSPTTGRMIADFNGKKILVTPNMFRETYREPGSPQPGQKKLSLPSTVAGFEKTPQEVKDSIDGMNYDTISNEVTLAEAKALIESDYNKAYKLCFDTTRPTRITNTIAALIMDKLQRDGNFEANTQLLHHTAKINKDAGQAIQALAMYRRLTPEGILRYADSLVRKAQEAGKFGKLIEELNAITDDAGRADFAKRHGIPYMSVAQAKALRNKAIEVQAMEPGRAKDLETGKMLLMISELIPKNIWDKISSLQVLAQLLNPKTFVRNIIGNGVFLGFENLSQAVGVPLDMLVGEITDKRTVSMPSFIDQIKGGIQGWTEGVEEAKAGVDIKGINAKDLPRASAFESKEMKSLEMLLNISLKATDRAFYQAAFRDSLRGQMQAGNVKVPTPEMVQVAHLDGLYRTFNDENALRTAFKSVKNAFNLGQTWGMGDMIIKYPGTPASILMRGIEYSPLGFIQAAHILATAGSKANFNQRAFVQSTARALTGTSMLVGTGMILATLGLIRGKDEDKKAIKETEAAIGIKDYQINISGLIRFLSSGLDPKAAVMRPNDLMVSYDWMQPAAINLAMGANLVKGAKNSGVAMLADAIEAAGTTLQEQPLVSGISRFFRSGSPIEGIIETFKGIPASFVPTVISQVRQLIDNVSRTTRTDSSWGDVLDSEIVNRVKMKIPGLSQTLAPWIDILGQVRKTYQNDTNNPFNVFLNPSFVTRYKPTPTTDLVLDIWARSGETIQIPRISPKQITVRGVKRPLTQMEQALFQNYIGKETSRVFTNLSRNRGFMALPDFVKAKELQSITTDINNMAKFKVLGVRQ